MKASLNNQVINGIGTQKSSAFGNSYLFTARRLDDKTGLYFYRKRYHQALMGRFLSRDSLRYSDGMNLYTYVRNNPVNFIDPKGEAAVSAIILAILGAIATAGLIVAGYKLWQKWRESVEIEKRLEQLSQLKKGLDPCSESFLAIQAEERYLRIQLAQLGSDASAIAADTGVTTPGTRGLPGPGIGPKPGRM